MDNDCDGVVDGDADPSTWYLDHDGDGFGDGDWPMTECDAPSGQVADASDCNDFEAADHPGAEEVCDGRDNDCDAEVDEGEMISVFVDTDSDGWGFGATLIGACDSMDGFSSLLGDCDDDDSTTYLVRRMNPMTASMPTAQGMTTTMMTPTGTCPKSTLAPTRRS